MSDRRYADADADVATPTAVPDERRDLAYRLQMARMQNRATTDIGLLVLRIGALMLLPHGIHKAMGYAGFRNAVASNGFGALAPDIFSFLVVAGQIALPILLLIGLFTRLSGLLMAVMMGFIAVVFVVPTSGLIDARTGGLSAESALLYAVLGLALFFTGGGRSSLDHAIGSGRRERRAVKHSERVDPVA